MSVIDIKSALQDFLEKDGPSVLCLSGKWGVGKTHLWNDCFNASKANVKLNHYSYVSLFGIGSLDELKIKTFLESVSIQEPTKNTDPKRITSFLLKFKRDANVIAPFVDIFADANKIMSSIGFRALSNNLVCIDDIERKSISLTISEVLSFASFLREEKGCKVVILMNSDALLDEDKTTLKKYQEKVVDTSIVLNTSCEEALEIAFEGKTDATSLFLKECIRKLVINNIRVIKKIQKSAEKIISLLPQNVFALSVREQALKTLCLYSWAHYDSGEHVPSVDFIRGYNQYNFAKDADDNKRALYKMLDEYGYRGTDEFDLQIYEFILHGYVLEDSFVHWANKLNARVAFTALEAEFHAAWDLFHGTLENNQDQLLDGLYTAFVHAVKTISPTNLDGTVSIFCDLGDQARAQQLIDIYIRERSDEPELFDLDAAFGEDIKQPLVMAAFRRVNSGLNRPLTLAETIDKVAIEGVGRRVDLAPMINASVDEYYAHFSSLRGRHDIREHLNTCLRFKDRNDETRSIGEKTIAALKRLSGESPVNKKRIARFINLQEEG